MKTLGLCWVIAALLSQCTVADKSTMMFHHADTSKMSRDKKTKGNKQKDR